LPPTLQLCFGKRPTIIGTPGNDYLDGPDEPDVIVGLGGNDHIDGRGRDDYICGNDGDDVIVGGLHYYTSNDSLAGGPGERHS
jgi:Ca2+-binding RTX toxin-like protein